MTEQSALTKKAFAHLNNIKPYDGWSIDMYVSSSGQNLCMLKRRNAPLSNRGFVELALEKEKGCVVGIVSHIGVTGTCAYARGVALVEQNGKLIRGAKEMRFTIDKIQGQRQKDGQKLKEAQAEFKQNKERAKDSVRNPDRGERNSGVDSITSSSTVIPEGLTDEQNQQLIKLAMIVIGIATLFRILYSAYFVLAAPVVTLYLMNTCPKTDTFDAKKELKRVLRGEYMPDNHREKPKNWLEETVTRLQATVTAEVATGLGHEVFFTNIFGLCILVTVHIPVMKIKLYYVGICDRWRYVLHMNSEASRAS